MIRPVGARVLARIVPTSMMHGSLWLPESSYKTTTVARIEAVGDGECPVQVGQYVMYEQRSGNEVPQFVEASATQLPNPYGGFSSDLILLSYDALIMTLELEGDIL